MNNNQFQWRHTALAAGLVASAAFAEKNYEHNLTGITTVMEAQQNVLRLVDASSQLSGTVERTTDECYTIVYPNGELLLCNNPTSQSCKFTGEIPVNDRNSCLYRLK